MILRTENVFRHSRYCNLGIALSKSEHKFACAHVDKCIEYGRGPGTNSTDATAALEHRQ